MKRVTPELCRRYERVNTLATVNLVKQAISSGVKRFIFISTIKVLGDKNSSENPFTHQSLLNPIGPYATSKADSEKEIIRLCAGSEMEYVILRPPLIYGDKPKGNLKTLEMLAGLPIPIPLGSLENLRSLISIQNFFDVLTLCMEHPSAANETLLVCDSNSVSTSELLGELRRKRSSKVKDFSVPSFVLKTILHSLGLKSKFQKLTETMVIDSSRTQSLLSWSPRQFKIRENERSRY